MIAGSCSSNPDARFSGCHLDTPFVIPPHTLSQPGIANAHNPNVMKKIILSSSNPILVKSLYGILRDEGYFVETIEHPVLAVQMVMNDKYDVLIIDSEPFGLSAEDAAEIVQTVAPGISILFVGRLQDKARVHAVETPLDLEEFKRTIHSIAV